MKKILLIFIVLGTMSCSVMRYEPKFTIGMAEQEFKQLNKSAMKVYGDNRDVIIYRTYNQLINTFKFFTFTNGKLVKFEESIYPDDYKYMKNPK